jgi:hypothetical protein
MVSTSRRPSNFRTVECKNFAKGSCAKGDNCTYKHSSYATVAAAGTSTSPNHVNSATGRRSIKESSPSSSQRLCDYFLQHGRCGYGDRCKFSHILVHDEHGEEIKREDVPQKQFLDLKSIIMAFSRLKQFQSTARFERFLELALKVLECNERDVRAEGVVALSKNDYPKNDSNDTGFAGYEIIRYIAEAVGNPPHPLFFTHPLRNLNFEKHVVPFMKIIVHDAFTQTCVEKSFHYVIKAVYGHDGTRGTRFLNAVVEILEQRIETADVILVESVSPEALYLVSRILYYIVRYNSEAIGIDEFSRIHVRLMEISSNVRNPFSTRLDRCLSETGAYLFPVAPTLEEIPVQHGNTTSLHDRYKQRELLIQRPGELSTSAPRHDNDHHLIAKISILPTKEEIHSDRDPYLPINDIAAPHFFEGPSRLFDIHFRLLREDMLGPLRNSVITILSKLQPNRPISQSLSQRDRIPGPNTASTRLYFNVTVASAGFDKTGLVIRLRFRQPNQLQKHSSQDRARYWEFSRSLEKDSLLCLISNVPEVKCFLTVVKKDCKLLSEDQRWCHIDVIPPTKFDSSVQDLLRYIHTGTPVSDSLALVEFPGVLFSAYKTILENLQTRSKHPFMPFSELLCPTTNELQNCEPDKRIISVRPPYDLPYGFEFDLSPLKKEKVSSAPLRLSSEASPKDLDLLHKLENETTLDLGQCEGLVAALTQELALVQGLSKPTNMLMVKVPQEPEKHILELRS